MLQNLHKNFLNSKSNSSVSSFTLHCHTLVLPTAFAGSFEQLARVLLFWFFERIPTETLMKLDTDK